jgi:hypothetical protein
MPTRRVGLNFAIRLFVLFNDNYVNPTVRHYFCGDRASWRRALPMNEYDAIASGGRGFRTYLSVT